MKRLTEAKSPDFNQHIWQPEVYRQFVITIQKM